MSEVLYWGVIGLSVFTTWCNLLDMWRRHRKSKREERALTESAAEFLGLTPLQLQCAMDDSLATFFNRIDALRNSTRGEHQ